MSTEDDACGYKTVVDRNHRPFESMVYWSERENFFDGRLIINLGEPPRFPCRIFANGFVESRSVGGRGEFAFSSHLE